MKQTFDKCMRKPTVYLRRMFKLLPFGAISAAVGIALTSYGHPIFYLLFLLPFLLLSVYKQTPQLFLIVSICGVFYMFLYMMHQEKAINRVVKSDSFSASIVIEDIPKIDGNRFSAIISSETYGRMMSFYTIQTKHEKTGLLNVQPGMRCEVTGERRVPKASTIPNGFQYREYLKTKDIDSLYMLQNIKNCSDGEHSHFLTRLRQKGLRFLEKHVPKDSVGIVQALVFGEREFIDADTLKAYQTLGIIHLLAISGLHVQTLTACLFWCMLRLGVTRGTAKLLLLLFLPVYVVLTGAAPSVLRACLMAGLYLIISSLPRRMKYPPAIILSLTFLFLLAINPLFLFDIGFQLSYAVTFFIVLSAKIISRAKSTWQQLFLVSFIAQLASLPILLYHFQQFSLLSIPLNVVFVPFYTILVMPASLLFFLISLVYLPIGQTFFQWLDVVVQWSHTFSLATAAIDVFDIILIKPEWWHVVLETVTILLLFVSLEQSRSVKRQIVPCLLVIFALFIHYLTPFMSESGEVTMLDVGQGDSLFIQLPYRNGNIMVDTGGKLSFEVEPWQKRRNISSIGDNVLIPFLTSRGVTKLDLLILTHADQDHMGEALLLLKRNKVKHLVVPKGFVHDVNDRDVLKEANRNGIPISELERGDMLAIGGFNMHVLHPSVAKQSNKNNDSLVLFFTLGGKRFVLTGDLEKEGEQEILHSYPHLNADILKIGHHGSKGSTSEEWLRRLKPSVAFISVGEGNRYLHPHEEVLKRIREEKIDIFRTDVNGSVSYEFREQTGTFRQYVPYDIIQNQ
ncbi:DNA internalization-related competence protein ComEC/Rec2 [Bacillus sp. NPDC077027]|uniref:DNA internalization-related competence protein ComEC/Rec2 n=1 Tax=Bacillus sp. NPDC077027 TaxID=3390548 RepID=UPI003D03680F